MKLMTHLVAGYPTPQESIERAVIMAQAGVAMLEVQIPFSDPIADGPAISAANTAAIASGIDVERALEITAEIIQQTHIPVILICYYNTIFQAQFQANSFISKLATLGVVGITVPDLIIDSPEGQELERECSEVGISLIHMVAPNTPADRLEQLVGSAKQYVYCQARFGITGQATEITPKVREYLQQVRSYATIAGVPMAVGFGISTAEHIQQLDGLADIAVVGSALLNIPTNKLATFIKELQV